MNLYIMTRGRVGKQHTLSRLPEKWKARTWLVVPRSELSQHDYFQVMAAPEYVTNYSQKFQWLLNGEGFMDWEKCVILDDDLVFSRKMTDGKLVTVKDPEELNELFDYMEQLLNVYPLVGVHPRQMGQNAPQPFVKNGRIICMQGINRRLVGKVKVDQFPILADVVLNCTLLSRGKENAIITTFFQDHGPCQAQGGCSIYRTSEMQTQAVEYIAHRFGPHARVVARNTKDKWLANEQGIRYDYTCQWKRLQAAGAAHLLDPGKVPHPDRESAWG